MIFIDDNSSDNTVSILKDFKLISNIQTHIIESSACFGPGICRNLGINFASGEYLIFLDSDDCLSTNFLVEIRSLLSNMHCLPDIIPFDYFVTPTLDLIYINSHKQLLRSRNDFDFFLNKSALIHSYLEMKMDGSVIFTAFRRSFLLDNKLFSKVFTKIFLFCLKYIV